MVRRQRKDVIDGGEEVTGECELIRVKGELIRGIPGAKYKGKMVRILTKYA